ncbi:hypothetical protein, partial [uncultured Intestinimonas sp.]|uniref:hypothetical protein n=1 Tax=uncultured Intestinimonas sp. TaxID=1689265 RepID=UPI0025F76617
MSRKIAAAEAENGPGAEDFLPFSKDFFSETPFSLETWDGLCYNGFHSKKQNEEVFDMLKLDLSNATPFLPEDWLTSR